ncbi:hypothetical protein PENSPDRAFT_695342 [Peniophora sp. CONT]|nr:hypothetical protein PENSPDRAFT_695342 [Peniophora sp. CONT]
MDAGTAAATAAAAAAAAASLPNDEQQDKESPQPPRRHAPKRATKAKKSQETVDSDEDMEDVGKDVGKAKSKGKEKEKAVEEDAGSDTAVKPRQTRKQAAEAQKQAAEEKDGEGKDADKEEDEKEEEEDKEEDEEKDEEKGQASLRRSPRKGKAAAPSEAGDADAQEDAQPKGKGKGRGRAASAPKTKTKPKPQPATKGKGNKGKKGAAAPSLTPWRFAGLTVHGDRPSREVFNYAKKGVPIDWYSLVQQPEFHGMHTSSLVHYIVPCQWCHRERHQCIFRPTASGPNQWTSACLCCFVLKRPCSRAPTPSIAIKLDEHLAFTYDQGAEPRTIAPPSLDIRVEWIELLIEGGQVEEWPEWLNANGVINDYYFITHYGIDMQEADSLFMTKLKSWWPTDKDYKAEYENFSRLNPKGLTGVDAATAISVDDSDDDSDAAPKTTTRGRCAQVKGEGSDVEMVDVPAAGPSRTKRVSVELKARPVAGRAGDKFAADLTAILNTLALLNEKVDRQSAQLEDQAEELTTLRKFLQRRFSYFGDNEAEEVEDDEEELGDEEEVEGEEEGDSGDDLDEDSDDGRGYEGTNPFYDEPPAPTKDTMDVDAPDGAAAAAGSAGSAAAAASTSEFYPYEHAAAARDAAAVTTPIPSPSTIAAPPPPIAQPSSPSSLPPPPSTATKPSGADASIPPLTDKDVDMPPAAPPARSPTVSQGASSKALDTLMDYGETQTPAPEATQPQAAAAEASTLDAAKPSAPEQQAAPAPASSIETPAAVNQGGQNAGTDATPTGQPVEKQASPAVAPTAPSAAAPAATPAATPAAAPATATAAPSAAAPALVASPSTHDSRATLSPTLSVHPPRTPEDTEITDALGGSVKSPAAAGVPPPIPNESDDDEDQPLSRAAIVKPVEKAKGRPLALATEFSLSAGLKRAVRTSSTGPAASTGPAGPAESAAADDTHEEVIAEGSGQGLEVPPTRKSGRNRAQAPRLVESRAAEAEAEARKKAAAERKAKRDAAKAAGAAAPKAGPSKRKRTAVPAEAAEGEEEEDAAPPPRKKAAPKKRN